MITFDPDRDLFQERRKTSQGEDILIIVSEEYINEKFNLSSNNYDTDELPKKQMESAQNLFSDIFLNVEKYKEFMISEKNSLKIIVLATTDTGITNIKNYLRGIGLYE